jgi:hypothetical protein
MTANSPVLVSATTPTAPDSFHPDTIDDLRGRSRSDPGWLWRGYLSPGNITLFTSLWKSGKTTLISVLLSKLGPGGVFAGLPLRSGRAVVVSEEPGEHWLARDDQLHFGPNVRFLCRPFLGRPTPEQWNAFVDRLLEMHRERGVDLVVIDTLASFLPSRSENNAGNMLDFLLPLQKLTVEGISLVILHHPRKGEPAEAQAARGSGALAGNVDIIVEMNWFSRPSDDDRRRILTAYSRHRATPRRLVIELSEDGTDYVSHGDSMVHEMNAGWPVLLGVLEDADRKLTRQQIRDNWPQDYPKPDGDATLWRWLDRAVKEGRVLCGGTGRKNSPFVYWLDGMEDVWASDPMRLPDPIELGNPFGIERKTLAEVLAERERRHKKREAMRLKRQQQAAAKSGETAA